MPETLLDILDSGWFRVAGYGVVAIQAIWLGMSERQSTAHARVRWPIYWFVSAIILITIGVFHAGEYDDFLSQWGRDQAWLGGWYRSRQTLQSITVVVAAGVCGIGALAAIWRMPRPRRRYLRHLLAMSSLVGFFAVRVVSLHNVDALLYRRDIASVRVVSIIELTLIAFAWFAAPAVDRVPCEADDGDLSASGRATLQR